MLGVGVADAVADGVAWREMLAAVRERAQLLVDDVRGEQVVAARGHAERVVLLRLELHPVVVLGEDGVDAHVVVQVVEHVLDAVPVSAHRRPYRAGGRFGQLRAQPRLHVGERLRHVGHGLDERVVPLVVVRFHLVDGVVVRGAQGVEVALQGLQPGEHVECVTVDEWLHRAVLRVQRGPPWHRGPVRQWFACHVTSSRSYRGIPQYSRWPVVSGAWSWRPRIPMSA